MIRVLMDAQQFGGLLADAVAQLHQNWYTVANAEKRGTWWGRMLIMARRTWPGFQVRFNPRISFIGLPTGCRGPLVHGRFANDAWTTRWHKRQEAILRSKPTIHQQDFLLYSILQDVGKMNEPLFTTVPSADAGAVRARIRTVAGIEDFARVNAHYDRRESIPGLSRDRYKRCCLACLTFHGTCVLDSEWHAIFECPFTAPARCRFEFATGIDMSTTYENNTLENFVTLFKHVRTTAHLVEKFSFFALDIRSTRRHLFRRLTSDGLSGRAKVTLRITFQQWRAALPARWIARHFQGSAFSETNLEVRNTRPWRA